VRTRTPNISTAFLFYLTLNQHRYLGVAMDKRVAALQAVDPVAAASGIIVDTFRQAKHWCCNRRLLVLRS